MSYIINNSRGQIVAVIPDGVVNTTATDLALIGQAVTNFGTYQNENYLYLLENFASGTAPTTPVLGQLWYNANTDVLNAYSSANTWAPLATRSYVDSALTALLINTSLSGTPTAPTAVSGTNTTQIATTEFVNQSISNFSGSINNATLTGNSTAVTAANGTATTQIATTAFVVNQLSGGGGASISTTGNIVAGNISATGNITAPNFIGNLIGNVSGNISGNITIGGANTQVVFNDNGVANASSGFTFDKVSNAVTMSGTLTVDVVLANNIVTTGTNAAFRLPNLTQSQIDALSPLNGDMVYNTTSNFAQVYQNGTWKIFTLSYYS